MADKFFHEFPTTTTLKDSSILLLDQDNQTTAITLAQLKSFLSTGGGGGTNTYTTVGNASAGIFVSTECFVNGEKGNWIAPDGVYSARITVVGGGGSIANGNRSHFNCPTGSTTVMNQIFANGGKFSSPTGAVYGGNGGGVAWNGINTYAKDGNGPAGYGHGGGGNTKAGSGTIANGGYGYGGNAGTHGAGFGDGMGGTSIICNIYGILGNENFQLLSNGICPELSYAAALNTKFVSALRQNRNKGPGCGGLRPASTRGGGGGGGWASAIVSITPKQSYSYEAGTAGDPSAGYGMVLIEY